MRTIISFCVPVVVILFVTVGCEGRRVTHEQDNGTIPDGFSYDLNLYDLTGIDLNGLDLNSLDIRLPDYGGGDAFDQSGPIARLQKSDLSVICPPDGQTEVPGFQNGETDILMDVVVTAPKQEASATLDRYFVAEATLTSATAWTGAAMTIKKELGLPDFNVGDVLSVTVSHLEYYCLTQLTATAATRIATDQTLAPVEVDPAEIGSQDPATAEKWEGVLVRFSNVKITDAAKPYGEFDITGGVTIKPSFGITYKPVAEEEFDEIVGVVDYSYGKYVVLPRSNQDLVLKGGQTPDIIEPGDMIDPPDVTYDLPEGVEPPTSIIAIQSADPSTGCTSTTSIKTIAEGVSFNDLVVVSPKFVAKAGQLDGYYVCQGLLNPLVPYSCVAMTIDVSAPEKFAPGDVIDAEGKVIEYYCFTEISTTAATKDGTADIPEAIELNPELLGSQNPSEIEPYEGVLVTVANVEITETPTNGSDGKDHGSFKVTGGMVVGNAFYLEYMNSRTDGRAVGQKFLSITGVVSYSYGRYELMPRTMADLEFDGDPIVVEKDQPDVIAPDVPDTPLTMHQIQSATPSTGCTADGFVNVFNNVGFAQVIVTAPKFSSTTSLDGYYVEDYPVGEDRSFNGMAVVAEKTLGLAFVPGDVITISDGDYYEYYCFSQVQINSATKNSTDTAPGPIDIDLSVLQNAGSGALARCEELEGLLVRIPATTITAATSSDSKTWFEVGNGIHVSNQFYIQGFTPTADAAIASITGLVRYHFGKFRIAPRSIDDIVMATK